MAFVHLHTHSEYSMLQSTASVGALVKRAKALGHSALALTDHGNMFGMLEFYRAAQKEGLKPIVGCDMYLAPDSRKNQVYLPGQVPHHRLTLLARDQEGYRNLLRLCSAGHLEGYLGKPRIDWELLEAHAGGLIALTGNFQGEIGHHLLKGAEAKAEECYARLRAAVGEDHVYLCVQDHGQEEEAAVNAHFLRWHAEKGAKLVAVNDVHYLEEKDAEAHAVLLCIDGGWRLNDPNRPRFPSSEFWMKPEEAMAEKLGHFPGALENTALIADACDVTIEFGTLHHPQFPIPAGFEDADAYLAHLAREGLAKRYPEVTPALSERLEFELATMKNMQVAGYMLIVQDFINAARAKGIPVGPGRGSAVGSLVSYAIGVTDVDPIRYSLLFERFLNPERVSMPDIDTDFSDTDRQAVIQYVVEKYGQESVAQIVTYGRMKAKMVLRDVGRVLGHEAQRMNYVCKLFPPNPFVTLSEALDQSPDLRKEVDGDPSLQELVALALKLEGLVRQAGMHAAAVIIAPRAVVNFAPLFKQPGSDQVMIQYDKTYSEDIGLLKMDFLGLRNLSVIQDALGQIKRNHGLDLDPLALPEGDPKTLALLGKGATVGVFQFESGGMQDYLRKLKPTCLEDMIAMNALYRPGPMEFIGQFIARKHGHEKVDCYHDDLKPILQETYGVIVYQEQVMQIAQVLSGFSLGGADLLRRAMAKKDLKKMDQLKPKFVGGAKERGYDPALAERIWEVLVPFSSYAFNKSHSAAYATIAYQTAYLKANYPAEFMAANMNSEMHDTSRLTVLLSDCRAMGIEVDFPDINRSEAHFTASREGRIVYGLAGIKNVGLSAVQALVEERAKNGPYRSLADLCKRVDGHLLNRRALEALIYAGALPDEIPGNRAQQFAAVEQTMAFAQGLQADAALGQVSLFDGGGSDGGAGLDGSEPPLPEVDPWPYNEMLEKEKEVLGLYLSGHPLESYRAELDAFTSSTLDPERLRALPAGQSFILGGMITKIKTRLSAKDNKTFAFAQLEDFWGKVEVNLWSDIFEDVRHQVELDSKVLIRGTLKYNEEMQLFKLTAEKVLPLDEARERLTRSVHVRFRTLGLEEEYVDRVLDLCQAYEGGVPLVLHLERPGREGMKVLSEAVRVSPEREFTDRLSELLGKGQCWLSSQAA